MVINIRKNYKGVGIREYYGLLENHDWYSYQSDCHTVYKKGEEEMELILAITEVSSHHREIYDDYVEYVTIPGTKRPDIENPKYWN